MALKKNTRILYNICVIYGINRERIKYSPKSINYQVTRTTSHWYSAGVVQTLWTGGVFVEHVGAMCIILYIYIMYNDVCRTIGPQTAGGHDNNNALIRLWVWV